MYFQEAMAPLPSPAPSPPLLQVTLNAGETATGGWVVARDRFGNTRSAVEHFVDSGDNVTVAASAVALSLTSGCGVGASTEGPWKRTRLWRLLYAVTALTLNF